jgi:hypothetical protein
LANGLGIYKLDRLIGKLRLLFGLVMHWINNIFQSTIKFHQTNPLNGIYFFWYLQMKKYFIMMYKIKLINILTKQSLISNSEDFEF